MESINSKTVSLESAHFGIDNDCIRNYLKSIILELINLEIVNLEPTNLKLTEIANDNNWNR